MLRKKLSVFFTFCFSFVSVRDMLPRHLFDPFQQQVLLLPPFDCSYIGSERVLNEFGQPIEMRNIRLLSWHLPFDDRLTGNMKSSIVKSFHLSYVLVTESIWWRATPRTSSHLEWAKNVITTSANVFLPLHYGSSIRGLRNARLVEPKRLCTRTRN